VAYRKSWRREYVDCHDHNQQLLSTPLAKLLLDRGCNVMMHDPYVKPEDQKLMKFNLQKYFTRDIEEALGSAEVAIFCTAHRMYFQQRDTMLGSAPKLQGIFDGCNLFKKSDFNRNIGYDGIGRGSDSPENLFVDFVYDGFRIMERGIANEVASFVNFANGRFAGDDFNRVDFKEVQHIAGTCVTGCEIVDPGPVDSVPEYKGFVPRLLKCAKKAWEEYKA
jgi:hypothetical protein